MEKTAQASKRRQMDWKFSRLDGESDHLFVVLLRSIQTPAVSIEGLKLRDDRASSHLVSWESSSCFISLFSEKLLRKMVLRFSFAFTVY